MLVKLYTQNKTQAIVSQHGVYHRQAAGLFGNFCGRKIGRNLILVSRTGTRHNRNRSDQNQLRHRQATEASVGSIHRNPLLLRSQRLALSGLSLIWPAFPKAVFSSIRKPCSRSLTRMGNFHELTSPSSG